MKRPLDILFVSTFQAPFIQDDLDILLKHYRVRPCVGKGAFHALKIIFEVLRTDIVFCWFASVYASIAVNVASMFGIKSVIVLGGVDIANDQRLGYGIWLSRWKSALVRNALRKANRVIVSDLSMKQKAIQLAMYSGGNIIYLPLGLDSEYWKPLGEKEPYILTVAAVAHHQRMLVKGIDGLIEAARRLPQYTFIVVGVEANVVFDYNPPANMTFKAAVPRKELLPYYSSAKVYCQPSVYEAFSLTLREAMLCECIPVASDVGGMPTAVSGVGLLVPPSNVDALVAALLKAMQMHPDAGAKARARIVALYPKEKRETELCRLLEGLG